jgi:heptosyltransferase-3
MGHIGDVVLVTPALELLQPLVPGADISMLVRSGTEAILDNHPLVRRVFTGGEIVSQQRMHVQTRSSLGQRLAQIPRGLSVVAELRREKFDVVVDFTSGDRSAILGFLSGAAIRVGHAAKGTGFAGRDNLYTHVCPAPDQDQPPRHRVWRDAGLLRDVARAVGRAALSTVEALSPGPSRIYPRPSDLAWARARWSELAPPDVARIVVHPTSRVLYKCWPANRWIDVIRALTAEREVCVVVTAGPANAERELAQTIVTTLGPKVHPQLGDMSLGQLAALISEANLFAGVDTAPMHIAAAVGTKVVALFGPSDDKVWGPWGVAHRVVRHACACLESGERRCDEAQGMACLTAVSTDEVLDAIRELL